MVKAPVTNHLNSYVINVKLVFITKNEYFKHTFCTVIKNMLTLNSNLHNSLQSRLEKNENSKKSKQFMVNDLMKLQIVFKHNIKK